MNFSDVQLDPPLPRGREIISRAVTRPSVYTSSLGAVCKTIVRPPGHKDPITIMTKSYDLWNTPVSDLHNILRIKIQESLKEPLKYSSECSPESSPESSPSGDDFESLESSEFTSELSSESSPSKEDLDEDLERELDLLPLPSMELISPHKRLDLPPSYFPSGCICGHMFDYRDVIYESRKRRHIRVPGITIHPKTPVVHIRLRK